MDGNDFRESNSVQERFKRQYDAAELEAQQFLDADEVKTLEQLIEKLDLEENIPKDILKLK